MGQYQQWLHHREIDQQLRHNLELLESELAQLQAQARPSEEMAPPSLDNVIIQALLGYHAAEIPIPPAQESLPILEPIFGSETLAKPTPAHTLPTIPVESSSAPVSPALLAWSRLPNLDAQKMQVPSLNINQPDTESRPEEEGLLPQDMTTFFNQHTYIVPQPKLPAWLENVISAPDVTEQLPNNPVDQQTLRTNRLVERWLERWRKTSPDSQEQ
jgi:hypothetical protein